MALCYFSVASHHILPGISPQDSEIPTHISPNQVLSVELRLHLPWKLSFFFFFFLYHKNQDFVKSVFSALSTTFMILSGKRHDLILRMPNCACSFTTLCLLMSLPAKGHGIHMHAWDWGPTAQVLLRSRHRHPDKH